MISWTQADVDRIIGKQQAAKRTETPHKRGVPKTATTVGAKPERDTGAARAQPQRKESPIVVIGIDPGTNTGFSVVLRGELNNVETTTIFMALTAVSGLRQKYPLNSILVRFEDARLRTWFGFKKKRKVFLESN